MYASKGFFPGIIFSISFQFFFSLFLEMQLLGPLYAPQFETSFLCCVCVNGWDMKTCWKIKGGFKKI